MNQQQLTNKHQLIETNNNLQKYSEANVFVAN